MRTTPKVKVKFTSCENTQRRILSLSSLSKITGYFIVNNAHQIVDFGTQTSSATCQKMRWGHAKSALKLLRKKPRKKAKYI